MMYGNYNEGGYGYGASGGYNAGGGNYGRRGVPGTGRGRGGRYRGGNYGAEKSLNDMHEHYGNYSESREAANSGNYGAEKDSMMALEYMLESVCEFIEMLSREADSQEEAQMIKKYTRKIGEM